MQFYTLIWIFLITLCNNTVYSQTLSEKLDALLKKKLPHATIGVLVKDAQTGQIIYSKNPDKLFYPASNIKLFTAAAALYHLKPDFRFVTTLSQKHKDLYLLFSGAPSLTIDNLNTLLMNLKQKGIRTIQGNIVLDTSRYKPPYYPGGVSYDDLGWYYAAPDTALILNENALNYSFISAQKIGMPVQIKSEIAANGLTIQNQVITVSKEQEKNECNLNIEIKENNTLRLFGCMAQNSKPKIMSLAIPNPELLAKQVIRKTLIQNKIELKGRIINGHQPSDTTLIASIQSDNLAQLITHMLQESDNLYANSITRQLGYALTGQGTQKQGVSAINKILTQNTHIDMSQVALSDGLGTRYNLATPKQIVTLLGDLYQDKNIGSKMINALPRSGVSGTLKYRMKKSILEKIVYAKTGTMHDISSLSGYLINPQGKNYIFSIIINGINTPISTAKSLEEQILLTIVSYPSSVTS